MNINLNFDKKSVIIVILLILLVLGWYYHSDRINSKNTELVQVQNIHKALSDSMRTYQNKEKEWVNEKLAIQIKTQYLEKNKILLTANQTELIKKVDEVNKHNQIISAALIQLSVKLDGLSNNKPVTLNDSSIQFTTTNDTLSYDIQIHNVKKFGKELPVLEFKKFDIPNKLFVEFHFLKNRKMGYPVSFSITNSNPFFHANNIDSYIIPEIKPKPTFWGKVGTFTSKSGTKIIIFGVGVIAGGLLLH